MGRAVEGWTGPSELELVVFALLGILLVAVLVLFWRRTRLMNQILTALGELHRGNTPQPLPLARSPGLRGLTRAFNEVARSVRPAPAPEAFVVPGARPAAADSELVTRLCQELRVPLSAIQGLVEDLLDETQAPLTPRQRERTMRLLANVKSLVDLLQEADDLSEIRRGLSAARRAAAGAASRGRSEKVLLVEDDQLFAREMIGYLQNVGYEVSHAQTGEAGIAMCQTLRPVAVVLDVLMPGQDAWYVLGEIKSSQRTKDLPLALVGNLPQKRAAVFLGGDDFLVKPVSPSTLLEKLSLWCPSGAAHILVVADKEPVRSALVECLESEGRHVTTLSSGAELLAQLAVPGEIAAQTLPQIAIIDLLFSDREGFEALYQWRVNPVWRKIPTLVLTAKHLSTREQQALASGATRLVTAHGRPLRSVAEEVLEWLHRVGTVPTAAAFGP